MLKISDTGSNNAMYMSETSTNLSLLLFLYFCHLLFKGEHFSFKFSFMFFSSFFNLFLYFLFPHKRILCLVYLLSVNKQSRDIRYNPVNNLE